MGLRLRHQYLDWTRAYSVQMLIKKQKQCLHEPFCLTFYS
jgi:hypothetical protein